MLWLYIILAVVALIALILLTPMGLHLKFTDSFACTLSIWFVKLRLYPPKPKKKKSGKKPSAKPHAKSEEKKKTNIFLQNGISGLIDILSRFASLAKGVLKDFFKHIIIKDFTLDIKISGDNAADTAISYGKYCSVIYPLVSVITKTTDCKKCVADIYPDFDEKAKTKVYFSAKIRIRLLYLISVVLRHGVKALKIMTSLSEKEN